MPTLSETISVEYQSMDPVHMPGSYLVYKGTKSSTYEIGDIKLVSRTSKEASENQAKRNLLRGWTKPFFGFGTLNGSGSGKAAIPSGKEDYQYMKTRDGAGVHSLNDVTPLTSTDINGIINTQGKAFPDLPGQSASTRAQKILTMLDAQGSSLIKRGKGMGSASDQYVRVPVPVDDKVQAGKRFLGAPPEVLYLTAYSSGSDVGGRLDKPTNINKVPVVITNLAYSYPNDVDYIPTLDGEPWPIIMTITISLVESHSAREFEQFDIFKYRDGLLPGF
jgi:hypothetical protein